MSEQTALITISQLPEIQEHLQALKDSWDARAAEAASMVCTDETVQALNKMRADMRKEYTEANEQRKAAKRKYLEPWDAVEATFKVCIEDAFKRADSSLKGTIDAYKDEIKAKCSEELKAYFMEVRELEKLDFLSYEQALKIGNIKISLTEAKKTTPNQLRGAIAGVISKVAIEVEQIQQMEDSAAIMAEYKTCFDVGRAVSAVQNRKRREEEEREAEAKRKAAQAEQAAAAARVEVAIAAPILAAPKQTQEQAEEKVYPVFRFTVFDARRSQLIKVRELLRQEGLKYE